MKVSVIVSCYNSNEQYLKECIESILNQTFEDFEFILANDGQNNIDIEKIIKTYNDKRIKYHDNIVNMGAGESFNNLISLTNGQYIALLDHDDISRPNRLKICVDMLDKYDELDFVSGRIHIFGNNKERDDGKAMLPKQVSQELFFYQPINNPTVMIRKSSWINNNLKFTNLLTGAMDYELWSRTKHLNHLILDDILLNYRKHETNITKIHKVRLRMNHASIIKRNLTEIGIDAPFILCQLLDPYNHFKFDDNIKNESILFFKENKNKLLSHISIELYERKLNEIENK